MKCETCKFFYNAREARGWKTPAYVCRRYPPPPQLFEYEFKESGSWQNTCRFGVQEPSPSPDWWCGEYQRKEDR